eukprot:SAG25_NODE_199_length_12089_cov_86.323853_7_plen_66_part_00
MSASIDGTCDIHNHDHNELLLPNMSQVATYLVSPPGPHCFNASSISHANPGREIIQHHRLIWRAS